MGTRILDTPLAVLHPVLGHVVVVLGEADFDLDLDWEWIVRSFAPLQFGQIDLEAAVAD